MERAWLPLRGEVDLGREGHVFAEAVGLGALAGSDPSILEARGFWASFNTLQTLLFIRKRRKVVRIMVIIGKYFFNSYYTNVKDFIT